MKPEPAQTAVQARTLPRSYWVVFSVGCVVFLLLGAVGLPLWLLLMGAWYVGWRARGW